MTEIFAAPGDSTEPPMPSTRQSANAAPLTVSIIIPLHRWNERSARSVTGCLELRQRTSVEVIVVSDRAIEELPDGARVVVTGATSDTSPAFKRDMGGSVARGRFLAYIDDDAYPESDWLQQALAGLAELGVDGIGGPGLTPSDSSWRERLSGAVYGSILGSGPLRHRFVPDGKPRMVDELPAYNFVVKRECIDAIGGWKSSFYGGEDTAVCTRLRLHGFRLAYTPRAVVYHYRRNAPAAHLRQVGNVGRHRGYFVRTRDASSLRGLYFVPALLTLCFPIATAFVVFAAIRAPYVTLSSIGVIWVALAALAVKDVGARALVFPALLLAHHLWYGINFAMGLTSRTLDADRDSGAPAGAAAGNERRASDG
jgi:hypothetical protein